MSNTEIDPILEGLTEQQLKDTIVRTVRDIALIKNDAKDYAKAAREAVKEKDERVTECLELIELKKAMADG
jgi:hypothetical protein